MEYCWFLFGQILSGLQNINEILIDNDTVSSALKRQDGGYIYI